MKYVYNSGQAPFFFRDLKFLAQNFTVVDDATAETLKQITTPLRVEGEEGFPELWRRYGTDR